MAFSDQFFRLDGKVALITGGCGGIGTVLCKGLASMGARIGVADRERERVAARVEMLKAQGIDAFGAAFDAMSVDDTRRMTDEIAKHFGRVDILVDTVGGNVKEELASDVSADGWHRVIALNLTTAMFQAQAAAKHMIAGGRGGKIIHV